MELMVQSKNMEVSERLLRYAQRKIGRLDRFLPNITEAKVEFSLERTKSQGDRLAVQVTLDCNGTLLRGEERAGDAFTAIDAVANALNHQIERYKAKLYKKGKNAQVREGKAAPIIEEEETVLGRVVRIKRFPMKPMPPEEAIEQMELLGHDFFLFFNIATDQFSVLYRRKDGDYGLIEPELL